MTIKEVRMELTQTSGKRIVDKSLIVWSALNRAIEKGMTIMDMIVKAISQSGAWKVLNGMVEDETSEQPNIYPQKSFEMLAMTVRESAKEYVARVKGLDNKVRYHKVEVADHKICHRMLSDRPHSTILVEKV